MTGTSDKDILLNEAKKTLEFFADIGLDKFECSDKSLQIINGWSFKAIEKKVAQCRKCGLGESRKKIVFGGGSFDANLMFIGIAPGYEEEQRSLPFAKREAGELLTKIISAMGFSRDFVYVCNLVKCRPENDRSPSDEEIAACFPFLKKQIEAIKPKIICALGGKPSRILLKKNDPISRLRGKIGEYEGIKIMPTFHPAQLIADPSKKRFVWEDMKKIMAIL